MPDTVIIIPDMYHYLMAPYLDSHLFACFYYLNFIDI